MLLAAAMVEVGAAEITFNPGTPWKTIAPNEFTINYDGVGNRPSLLGKIPLMKAGTFGKITWEGKVGDTCSKNMVHINFPSGKKHIRFKWCPGTEYAEHTIFFYCAEEETPEFSFYIDPGVGENLSIRNVKFEEIPESKMNQNLIPDGDFEKNSIPSFFQRHNGKNYESGNIVSSPAAFSGRKSFQIQGSANQDVVFISDRMPAIPGKTAVLTFWAKTDAEAPLRVVMNMYGLLNFGGKHLYADKTFEIGTDWKEYTFEFPIPTDTATYPALNDKLLFLHFHWNKNAAAPALYLDKLEYTLR